MVSLLSLATTSMMLASVSPKDAGAGRKSPLQAAAAVVETVADLEIFWGVLLRSSWGFQWWRWSLHWATGLAGFEEERWQLGFPASREGTQRLKVSVARWPRRDMLMV